MGWRLLTEEASNETIPIHHWRVVQDELFCDVGISDHKAKEPLYPGRIIRMPAARCGTININMRV